MQLLNRRNVILKFSRACAGHCLVLDKLGVNLILYLLWLSFNLIYWSLWNTYSTLDQVLKMRIYSMIWYKWYTSTHRYINPFSLYKRKRLIPYIFITYYYFPIYEIVCHDKTTVFITTLQWIIRYFVNLHKCQHSSLYKYQFIVIVHNMQDLLLFLTICK